METEEQMDKARRILKRKYLGTVWQVSKTCVTPEELQDLASTIEGVNVEIRHTSKSGAEADYLYKMIGGGILAGLSPQVACYWGAPFSVAMENTRLRRKNLSEIKDAVELAVFLTPRDTPERVMIWVGGHLPAIWRTAFDGLADNGFARYWS